MKKKALTFLLAAIVSVTILGCSEKTNSNTSKKENDEIVITVASRYAGDVPMENYFRKKVEEFNNMDNGIRVEMDNIATETDYADKLRTSFANGDVPNVFLEFGGSRTRDYLEADALVDLKPYLEANNNEWYNTFYENMWDQSKYEGYDGIYSVPYGNYLIAMYYNKDLFAQANCEPPKSIEDLMTVCEKLKSKGILPFQVGEKDNFRFGHFHNNLVIKTLGIDAVDQLASRELTYDSEELIETYRIIEEMVDKGYFGEDILDTDLAMENAAFLNEKAAMHFDGTWFIANELAGNDLYDNIGIIPFPYGNIDCANYAQGGVSDLFYVSKLNKSDEEIEASIEFLKYITSPDYFAGLYRETQILTPVKFDIPSDVVANPLLDDAKEILSNTTAVRTDIQNYDSAPQMLDIVRSALQGLAMGDSAEQCAQNIMSRVDELD